MPRSKVFWFFTVLTLATPALLVAFAGEDGPTSDTWGNSIVLAAGMATANALVWSKRETTEQ
ncbi:hypothetical protein [Streptomyces sp. TR06-5]|uniref:hypothetical protein n=1 Tax=unclassified Streptomyces TaxID=2593676 RepID=UPI0039A2E325